MRLWIPISVAAIAVVAGCQQAQPKPAAQQGMSPTTSVLDVTAPRTTHAPSVYAIPPSVPRALPASYATTASSAYAARSAGPGYLPPGADESYAPVNSPNGATPAPGVAHASKAIIAPAKGKPGRSAGRTYLVKQGDTLFRIAREQYGSGGEWRRIAEANPGLTPATLKAGQKLVMP
ncbi:MAG TPA: LysM domain-containing protein [Tepidisphaeraceae bacterium]